MIGSNLEEGGERPLALEEGRHVRELVIHTAQDDESERSVSDRLVEIPEGINHALQLPAIVSDVEITFDKGAILGVEDEGPRLPVADELLFKAEPHEPCGGVGRHDDLNEIRGDGAVKPLTNDTVPPAPVGGVSANGVG